MIKLDIELNKGKAFHFWLQEMSALNSRPENYQKHWREKVGVFDTKQQELLSEYANFLDVYGERENSNYVWDIFNEKVLELTEKETKTTQDALLSFKMTFDELWSQEAESLRDFTLFLQKPPTNIMQATDCYLHKAQIFFDDNGHLPKEVTVNVVLNNRYGATARSNEYSPDRIIVTQPGTTKSPEDMYASLLHELTHLLEFISPMRDLLRKNFTTFATEYISSAFPSIGKELEWEDVKMIAIEPVITAMASYDLSYFKMELLKKHTKEDTQLIERLSQRNFKDNPTFLKYHVYAVAVRCQPLVREYLDAERALDQSFVNEYISIWKEYVLSDFPVSSF